MRTLIGFAILAVIAILADATPSRAQPQACDSNNPTAVTLPSVTLPSVTLPSVTICGVQAASVNQYFGIQYGVANRWMKSSLAEPPTNYSTMSNYGPICPQNINISPPPEMNEQCLYLNVWVPNPNNSKGPYPVLVFIHGGAFIAGAGSDPIYDGANFAANNNVIVVTLNYRLGALGFLSASVPSGSVSKGASTPVAGNFGLQDQQTALQWVDQYIESFGGDKSRITVFGESAGAMSVGLHLFAIPSSSGLFDAAIMESNPFASQYPTSAVATDAGNQFITTLCETVTKPDILGIYAQCLRLVNTINLNNFFDPSITYQNILAAQAAFSDSSLFQTLQEMTSFSLTWSPNVDGNLVTLDPIQSLTAPANSTSPPPLPPAPVPIAFGVNANEGTLFASLMYNSKFEPIDGLDYSAFVSFMFPSQASNILNTSAYKPGTYSDFTYTTTDNSTQKVESTTTLLSGVGYAVGQIMTDFGFACGNVAIADKLAGNSNSKPIYGYQFTQSPAYNVYSSANSQPPTWQAPPTPIWACNPSTKQSVSVSGFTYTTNLPSNNVCHGSELTYVFSTLSTLQADNPEPNYSPTSGDAALASSMNAAWAGFAKNPSAPPSPWTAYTPSTSSPVNGMPAPGSVIVLNSGNQSSPTTSVLATTANCTNIWSNTPLYKTPSSSTAAPK